MKHLFTIPYLILLAALLIAPVAAEAQSLTYAVEAGAGAYLLTTPHTAADFNLVIGNLTSRAASFTTFEIRPVTASTPSTTMRTGAQYTVASSGKVDLAGIVQGGGSSNATGASASFAGGLKFSFYPGWSRAPGLYFAFTGQALGDSSNGWNPQAALWVGYTFADAAKSLSARRLIAAARRRP